MDFFNVSSLIALHAQDNSVVDYRSSFQRQGIETFGTDQ